MTPPTYQELKEALEKALNVAETTGKPNYGPLNACWYDAAKKVLTRAESAKLVGTYQWINVEERLPETLNHPEHDVYYVAVQSPRARWVAPAYFVEGEFTDGEDLIPYVTHWIPELQHPSTLEGGAK